MTLRSRNRIFRIFFVCSLLVLLGTAFVFFYAGFKDCITPPVNPYRKIPFFSNSFLFSYHFICSVTGIFAFALFTPLAAIGLTTGFEKTQSIEVNYFMCFLLGCLCETSRIFIPINNLWQTTSTSILFIGRLVITGRMLCPLSILFAALFSENEQRQNVERNILIILIVSVLTGLLIPLDTYHTTSTLTVLWGTKTLYTVVRVLICVSTYAAMLTNAITKYNTELKQSTLGYVIMISGYAFLCAADCYFFLVAGILAIGFGSFYYLRNVHKMYLWR